MLNVNGDPLKSIRVLELSHGIPGPQLGKIMADFGAQVLRIESPEPVGGQAGSQQDRRGKIPLHTEIHRNKLCITLDLKRLSDQEKFKRLVALSDVVIANFSAGVMTRFGLDYQVLRDVNPTIIMIDLSGLGQEGPKKHYATWGPNLLPFMGKTQLWSHPTTPYPVGTQHPHPDYYAGTAGCLLILSAIYQRSRTGVGQYFDVAQVETAAPLITPQYNEYYVNKTPPQPKGNSNDHMAPHGIYRCNGDDQWVAIAVRHDKDWKGFKKALGNPSWANTQRFSTQLSRVEHASDLDSLVEEWTLQREPREAVQALQKFGVPSAEVHAAPGLKDDEQLNFRGFWTPTENPFLPPLLYAGQPIKLSEAPFKLRRRAPLIGEHNGEIIGDLLGLE